MMPRHLPTSWFRVLAAWSLLLGPLGCSDPERHGTATLIELGEYAWHMEWADHGQYMTAISGVDREALDGTAPDYSMERITVHPIGTWEVAGEVRIQGDIHDVFSCGDPNTVAALENSGPIDDTPWLYLNHISFHKLDSGQIPVSHTTSGYYNVPSSDRRWFPYTYECDLTTNTMYMRWESAKIVALDGSTGEILREFTRTLAPGQEGGPGFFIQPEEDRLVWLEYQYGGSEVRTFRLSTASPIGSVCLTCGTEWAIMDYLPIDNGHIVGITGQFPSYCDTHSSSTAIAVVDLDTLEVEQRFCLPNRISGGAVVIPGTPAYLTVFVRKMPEECWEVRTINLATGSENPIVDLCNLNQAGISVYPEVGRVLVTELEPDDGKDGYLWWMYTWPERQLVNHGRHSLTYDASALLPERGLLAVQSSAQDKFGLLDALEGGIIDSFQPCTGIQESTLRVDPAGRWATTLCFGDWSDVHTQQDKPRGTGFAVVDLEQYQGL